MLPRALLALVLLALPLAAQGGYTTEKVPELVPEPAKNAPATWIRSYENEQAWKTYVAAIPEPKRE